MTYYIPEEFYSLNDNVDGKLEPQFDLIIPVSFWFRRG